MQTGYKYKYLAPQALARVGNLRFVARGVVEGMLTGMHASSHKGYSAEFAEHREYVTGDDPRHLDFKKFAKTERLFVKQYEAETNRRVQIILDASGSMAFKHSVTITKFEYAASLTAVLAYLMIKQQDSVGLTLFDTEIRLDIPVKNSPRHFYEMMEHLETIQPGCQTGIAQTLHRLASRFKKRSLIVLISDLYDDPDEIARALHHFTHHRHEVVLFHVFDRAELDFPFAESMAFHDLETQERVVVHPREMRNAYLEEVRRFTDHYRRCCGESGIDYIVTDTTVPYEEMLTRYIAGPRIVQ